MASIEATAAKRQRSMDRIAAKLGIQFQFVHGDPEHRFACYLEQIADSLDPKNEAVQPYIVHKAEVPQSAHKEQAPPTPAEPLPALPDGYAVFGHSGGYVLMERGVEKYLGPKGQWQDRPQSNDTFDTERQAIQAAIALSQPKPSVQKEKRHGRTNTPQA